MDAVFNLKIKQDQVKPWLETVRKNSEGATKLMTLIYGKVHTDVMLNFRNQGAPPDIFKEEPGDTIRPWAPLSDYQRACRAAGGESTPGGILQASGQLYASMGKIRVITPRSMEYGTPHPLSRVHHFGAEGANAIRPKRAKALTLPFPGVTGRARDYTNTFIRYRTIFQAVKGQPPVPLFFLKDFVVIKARPMMTIRKKTIDSIAQLQAAFVTGTLKL